ncbi:MAG: phosphatase PAP2 family protein [Gemmatimonadaceae bacterium]|nr:phosphatase PAP2 family protein [Gemmatimonadaceae bacterium]
MTASMIERPVRRSSALYLAIIFTALFAILTAIVMSNETSALDRELILSLRSEATPILTTMLLAVTFISGRLAIPAAILFFAAVYRRIGARASAYYAGACITAEALNAIIKHEVARVRPHGVSPRLTAAGGFSYPSADAMLAVVIFGLGTLMLTWTIRDRRVRAAAIGVAALFIVLAAVARVYLGAHWPTDVLGGALAGTACAAFWVVALDRAPGVPTAP